jgi:cytochrome c oxidase subunit 3/cytochrome o ubiquinol oxidase subunit 3
MQTATVEPMPSSALAWNLPSRRRVGVACLIATESSLFSIFLIAYLFYMGKSATGPTPRDLLEVPVLSTICLLSSSVTIVLAERALGRRTDGCIPALARSDDPTRGRVPRVDGARMVSADLRALFHDPYEPVRHDLLLARRPSCLARDRGLALLSLVFYFSVRGVAIGPHRERVEVLSWYWHFVDVVWVVVFTVVYVLGRY